MLKTNGKSLLLYVAILAIGTACADVSGGRKKIRLATRQTKAVDKTQTTAPQGEATQNTQQGADANNTTLPEIVTPAGESDQQREYSEAREQLVETGTEILVDELPEGTYVVDSVATELRITKMKGAESTFFGLLQTFSKAEGQLVPGQTLSFGDPGEELDSAVTLNFLATFDLAIDSKASGGLKTAQVKSPQASGITMKANLADPSKIQDATSFTGQGKISNLDVIQTADDRSQKLITSKAASATLGRHVEAKLMKISDRQIRTMITIYKDAQKQVLRNLFVTYNVTPLSKDSGSEGDSATQNQDANSGGSQSKTMLFQDENNNRVTVQTDTPDNVDVDMTDDLSADSLDGLTLEVGDAVKN